MEKEIMQRAVFLATVAAMVLSSELSLGRDSCQRVGHQTRCSNGELFERFGKTTYDRNGSYWQQLGNQTSGGRGKLHQEFKNQTYDSHGKSSGPLGRDTNERNVTSCKRVGDVVACN